MHAHGFSCLSSVFTNCVFPVRWFFFCAQAQYFVHFCLPTPISPYSVLGHFVCTGVEVRVFEVFLPIAHSPCVVLFLVRRRSRAFWADIRSSNDPLLISYATGVALNSCIQCVCVCVFRKLCIACVLFFVCIGSVLFTLWGANPNPNLIQPVHFLCCRGACYIPVFSIGSRIVL